PLESDRIHVPRVPRDVGDFLDPAVQRRVEAVIHARREPQRYVRAVAILRLKRGIRDEIGELVRKSLGLKDPRPFDSAAGPDDRVARADRNVPTRIDGARTVLQLADEAFLQTLELTLFGFSQVQVVRKDSPDRNRQPRQGRTLDGAVPTHEAREQPAWDAVGQQEVHPLVLRPRADRAYGSELTQPTAPARRPRRRPGRHPSRRWHRPDRAVPRQDPGPA